MVFLPESLCVSSGDVVTVIGNTFMKDHYWVSQAPESTYMQHEKALLAKFNKNNLERTEALLQAYTKLKKSGKS